MNGWGREGFWVEFTICWIWIFCEIVKWNAWQVVRDRSLKLCRDNGAGAINFRDSKWRHYAVWDHAGRVGRVRRGQRSSFSQEDGELQCEGGRSKGWGRPKSGCWLGGWMLKEGSLFGWFVLSEWTGRQALLWECISRETGERNDWKIELLDSIWGRLSMEHRNL